MIKFIKRLMNRPNAYTKDQYYKGFTIPGGNNVSHDQALKLSAVWRAVRLISQTVAGLPFHVQKIDGKKRERLAGHNTDRLISVAPNEEQTAFSFWESITSWALTWGNGYAVIEQQLNKQPAALWLHGPDVMRPERTKAGKLVYVHQDQTVYNADEILHIHGPGWNGLEGMSVISYACETIASGLAADKFTASFFKNNATLGTILEHPGQLSEDAQDKLKKQMDQFKGSDKAYKTFLAEEGMKVTTLGIPPEDAQLLESKQNTVLDVARWFGIPPHKLMHLLNATFTNIEHQGIEFVQDGILPWALRIEQECNAKLFGFRQRSNLRTKMHLQGLMRGDQASRSAFYQTMFNMGVFSPNDIAELEDRNPVGKGGDKRFVQMNLTTLEKAGEDPPKPPPPAPTDDPVPDELQEAAETIERRENARFAEVANQTPEKLAKWREKFAAEHCFYIQKRLNDAMDSIAATNGLNPNGARVVIMAEAQSRADDIREGIACEDSVTLANRLYTDCMIAMHLKLTG